MKRDEADYRKLGFPSRHMFDFPGIVNVEVFRGACPCQCVHCPVGTTPPGRRAARFGVRGMDLDLYDRITREIGHHDRSVVRIHSAGDPILWKDLRQALQIGKRNRVLSWLFTSAVTSDWELIDEIGRNADIVEVSVNSSSANDYRTTKGVDAFDLVVGNIRRLRRGKRRRNSARLLVSRVESGDPGDAEFVSYWKASGLVDDAFVRSYHSYNDVIPERAFSGTPARHEACLVHWARFSIGVDGRAVVCFNELFKERMDPSLVLGDLHEQSIADIWHGLKLTALRKAELTGDYSGLPFGRALPCMNCRFCQPLGGSRRTSEHQVAQLSQAST